MNISADLVARVLAALDRGEGITRAELALVLGHSEGTVQQALAALVATGAAVRERLHHGVKGQPPYLYRLAPAPGGA